MPEAERQLRAKKSPPEPTHQAVSHAARQAAPASVPLGHVEAARGSGRCSVRNIPAHYASLPRSTSASGCCGQHGCAWAGRSQRQGREVTSRGAKIRGDRSSQPRTRDVSTVPPGSPRASWAGCFSGTCSELQLGAAISPAGLREKAQLEPHSTPVASPPPAASGTSAQLSTAAPHWSWPSPRSPCRPPGAKGRF